MTLQKMRRKDKNFSDPIYEQIKVEALEDWYGVKVKDNNYPECKGREKQKVLAVLRMICRF